MAAHYEDQPETIENGIRTTNIRIWYDDPRESPGFAERGQPFAVHFDSPDKEKVVDMAIEQAMSLLPPQTAFDIRAKQRPAITKTHYGRGRVKTRDEMAAEWGIAWYTHAAMQSDYRAYPLMERVPIYEAVEDRLGGYLLIDRMITPKAPVPNELTDSRRLA